MKRLLLFLLLPAGFIGAMQPKVQFAPQVILGTQLLEVHNRSNEDVPFFIIRADKSKVGPITIIPTQRWTANIPINIGDTLYVMPGSKVVPYSPSGKTPFIDLIIHPDNKVEVRSAGQ